MNDSTNPTVTRREQAARDEGTAYAQHNGMDLDDIGLGALARGFHDGYLAALAKHVPVGITLIEATNNIGKPVTYIPRPGAEEDGVIVRVSGSYVFVAYGDDAVGKATRPNDLAWI